MQFKSSCLVNGQGAKIQVDGDFIRVKGVFGAVLWQCHGDDITGFGVYPAVFSYTIRINVRSRESFEIRSFPKHKFKKLQRCFPKLYPGI